MAEDLLNAIGIVGMSCRFPRSSSPEEFWELLRGGVDAITFLSDEDLTDAGVDSELMKNPGYVRARGVVADIDLFDAGFFGFSPREAELTDPQQRLFLECAWTALEDAGHDPDTYPGRIGVYAGVGWSSYMLRNIASHPGVFESEAGHQALLGNDKDNLTTRVSYKLNLKGPSVTVQTGCSTSLVAIVLACQSLLSHQCDLTLSGGVSVMVPQGGYLYQPGGILSPDGRCRAFDAQAQGTVVGSGVGVVVLKRLEDALEDGDHIYAVIKASAVNNDGADKVGYTAPSVEGQAEVIVEAHAMASVSPESITYVETHGTGTALGDPIEMAALTKAFRAGTTRRNFCAVGSVKTNIGHLDAAAGVAGLIKTVLALKHREIPASLHFEIPNPQIDFGDSPFHVNTSLVPWRTDGGPRRAGVSSFGLGGTNAHVILEEAPIAAPSLEDGSAKLVVLSAKTTEALENATGRLAEYLRRNSELGLGDVAYTLQVGRKSFPRRRFTVCKSTEEAIAALEARDPQRVRSYSSRTKDRDVAFMFPGQGSQHVNMARSLYETEPTFRKEMDVCLAILRKQCGVDLLPILFPSNLNLDEAAELLIRTENSQPALFTIEYAMARMWMSWGVAMRMAIGHSIGEYVAAALAEVFSLEDALSIVALRSRLMQALPAGAMLAIPIASNEVTPLLGSELSLAAVNELSSCVISGPVEAIEAFRQELESREISSHRLETSHAFHSQMMEGMVGAFAEHLERINIHRPTIPFISNVTGSWITNEEATDSHYWASHVRQPVRFAEGLRLLLALNPVLLEVGPGKTLGRFAIRHPERKQDQLVLSSLRCANGNESDMEAVLECLGQLWLRGVSVDWPAVNRQSGHHRVRLPTYPFERQRYWMAPAKLTPGPTANVGRTVVEVAQAEAKASIQDLDQQTHFQGQSWIDALCLAYINLAVRRLGAFGRAADSYSNDELLETCKIVPRYHSLFKGMLSTLLERSQLRLEGNLLRDLAPCSVRRANTLAGVARQAGVDHALIDLIQTCGSRLPEVLLGDAEPLELFASVLEEDDRSASHSRQSLEDGFNNVVRAIAAQVLERLPSESTLRILEVGGGTGIASTALLPALSPERTEYTFTDVGKLFLTRAQKKFAAYPFVRYGLFNLDCDPDQQGYAGDYDIILAVNVLHVTRNIGNTLTRLRSLLRPGGLLLIWEITKPTLDFEVTYGLLMNPIQDGNRSQGNPFLSRHLWLEMLHSHGFDSVTALPDDDRLGQNLFVAQASQSKTIKAEVDTVSAAARQTQELLTKKTNISSWFHIPSWKRTGLPPRADTFDIGTWLVFVDSGGLGNELVAALKSQQQEVIVVTAGSELCREASSAYTINPSRPEDYATLLTEVRPRNIVHFWGVTAECETAIVAKPDLSNFFSLLFLAQAIGGAKLTDPVDLTIVSNYQQEVTGEETISPEKSLTLAPAKVIPLEYPNVQCRSVDVIIRSNQEHYQLVEQLLNEVRGHAADQVVAYRDSHRWVQTIEPIELLPPDEDKPRLREGGVYLITGGFGTIGLTIARYFAKSVSAKLVLTGRSGPRHEDDIRELEEMGAAVMIDTSDVGDLNAMQAVVKRARQQFGQINGVIHSAGVLGDGSIQQKTPAEIDEVLRAKVLGTLVLDSIFSDAPLDFFVLFSSLSAWKPGFGQVAYSAANNFLDAFVRSRGARKHRLVTSISWDVWQGNGMAYDAVAPQSLQQLKEADFKQRGILPVEGIEVFRRVLGGAYPHVMVSTSDYLMSGHRDLSQLYLERAKTRDTFAHLHARPNLGSAYAPPANPTEERLTQILNDLLGVADIGVEDNFFELGGDSLIGTQLIARLRTVMGVSLPTQSIYLYPTIRSFGVAVEEALITQSSAAKLDEALREVKRI